MKNIIIKIVSGVLFSVVGMVVSTTFLSYILRIIYKDTPSNIIELIHNYLLSFSYGLGNFGSILGAIVLAGIIGMFFFLGFWTCEKIIFYIHNYTLRKSEGYLK